MNNSQQTIRVGLFFVLGLALAWITFESLNGGQLFKKHGYTVVAPFANLKGLKNGDDVQMAGVKIGTVGATRLGRERVEAVLNIEPTVQIPNDAVASVETSSLLGSQHLAVSFGKSNVMLKDGDTIQTKNTPDMNEVISQLGALGSKLEAVAGDIGKALGGGGEGGSGSLFTKLDKLVSDNGPKLTETVSNLQDITAKLKNGDGTLGRLINDPKLHDELLASVTEIKGAAADARTFMADTKTIMADVRAGKGTIGMLLYDDATAQNVKMTVANIRGVSDKLARGEGTLGKLMTDDAIYKDVQAMMKKADRALDILNDQGPITAVGIAASTLF
ncbi:MAG TPA: MlaD family protein [Candidatus Didemnitutus sp.]|nr:MlaD family protein [Candidatus Didemnitutus sp.]